MSNNNLFQKKRRRENKSKTKKIKHPLPEIQMTAIFKRKYVLGQNWLTSE